MEFILASQSPRRKEILDMLSLEYKQESSDLEERIDPLIAPEINAMSIAFQKAYSISKNNVNKTVIAADTIVVINNKILGKPENDDDAMEMLALLNNKTHHVYTGIALINLALDIKVVDFDRTEVVFKNNSIKKLEKYIESKEPFGKAGAYAIQGKGGLLVDHFIGSFFNVIGLPIDTLNNNLIKYFNYYIL
ncbi:MAG TPA: Maf family protein [Clostridia bacterium]|nr:Maf family protein [Clostridia bacterium]